MPISNAYNDDYKIGLKDFPEKYFDLAIEDPEWGISLGKMAFLTEKKKTVKQKNGSRMILKNKTIYDKNEWDQESADQNYFDEIRRVSKHQIIFGIDYMNWEGVGTGRIKWDKGFPDGVSFKRYEVAYCSLFDHEVEIPLLWNGMMQAKSLKEPMVQQGNKRLNEKRIHPCHKPRLLYRKLLLDYAKPGFKILDSHMGSQSSRIEAYHLNMDYWGWEKDVKYYNDGCKRFNQFLLQQKLF